MSGVCPQIAESYRNFKQKAGGSSAGAVLGRWRFCEIESRVLGAFSLGWLMEVVMVRAHSARWTGVCSGGALGGAVSGAGVD